MSWAHLVNIFWVIFQEESWTKVLDWYCLSALLIKNYREKVEGRREGRKERKERKEEKEERREGGLVTFLEHLFCSVNTSQCVGRQMETPIWSSHLLHDAVCGFSFLTVLPCLFTSVPELSLFYLLLFSYRPVNVAVSRSLGPGVGGAGWETFCSSTSILASLLIHLLTWPLF